jgi:hypothetical protein
LFQNSLSETVCKYPKSAFMNYPSLLKVSVKKIPNFLVKKIGKGKYLFYLINSRNRKLHLTIVINLNIGYI